MNAVGWLGNCLSQGVGVVSGPFHPFGGAVDIIVVEQPDGSFKSSPWYVQFGNFQGVLKTTEKVVDISVNGVEADFHMYLSHKGEAYFLEEVEVEQEEPVTCPTSSGDEMDRQSQGGLVPLKSKSCDFGGNKLGSVGEIELSNGETVARVSSRQSRILGYVFGRKSIEERELQDRSGPGVERTSSLDCAELAADLLDVKWSTNLAVDMMNKDNAQQLPASATSSGVPDSNIPIDCEQSPLRSSVVENDENNLVDNGLHEKATAHSEQTGDNLYASPHEHAALTPTTIKNDNAHQVMLQCSNTLAVGPICDSAEGVKRKSISLVSSSSDSSHLVQDGSITPDKKINNQPSLESRDSIKDKVYNDQVPYNSREEQFVFSDLDEFKLHSPRGTENDTDKEKLHDLEIPTLSSTMTSDIVDIPESCKPTGEEGSQHVESLPNMSLQMEDQNANDIGHPLSQSVDNDSKLKWLFLREKGPCLKNKDGKCSYILELGHPYNEDTQNSVDQRNILSRHAAEISLCKHLLYEGMGVDVASWAFDSQKLDIDKFSNMDMEILKDDRLVIRIDGQYFPLDSASAHVLRLVSCDSDLIFDAKDSIPVEQAEKCHQGDPSKANVASPVSWRVWPFSSKGSRSGEAMRQDFNAARTFSYDNASGSITGTYAEKEVRKPKVVKKTKRTKTPTSEQLASLRLNKEMKFKEGMNLVTFTFSTAMLGKKQIDARIYLWKWNTRIVISDVDGTITKSDVLGQFMPLVGMDWSQTGVTNLFQAIKENGYQLLFLSARSISQAYLTRQFLLNLKQDGKLLPDGPVVISPDGLIPSLFREVVRRVPQEFKIACLKDIKALFPSECNPFYAGFGNRDTDELSYLNVGIPRGKIFIINPRGEVALSRCVETKSYTTLHALVNDVFPPMSSNEQEDYNEWNFWKLPTPAIDI